jgi:putative glycosyltransferase (TIGR04372 family)
MTQSTAGRVAAFALQQAIKTIRQPSRLLAVALSRWPNFSGVVLRLLPDRLIATGGGKEFCIKTGYQLFQRDHPVQAWAWFERALSTGQPSSDDILLAATCLYHGLGRFRAAMALFTRVNEGDNAEARRLNLTDYPFRVVDNFWTRHVGDTAILDYVIKLGILENRRPEETILYLPPGSRIANSFIFQQVATLLRVVDDPADLPFDEPAMRALYFHPLAPRKPDGATVYFWEMGGETYRRWHQEGRGALLSLPPETKARGWAALHGAGVPQGSWFVALHVREGKWYGQNTGPRGILNADIATYMPAIAEITRRGGWVIRMGDPGMSPLPSLPNVIDYCHSDLRADWMDVFIGSQCRFMVGTASGPAFIPPAYGVPLVLTNWWPPAQRPWQPGDIFVPKLARRRGDGRHLTLSETLAEPFSFCHSRGYLAGHEGVDVEDCDPEMLRTAVEEMLQRLDGNLDDNTKVLNLRADAERIYKSCGIFGMGQLAAGFLQRHGDFIA